MKIKKIIALAAATVMAFSTVANAAVSFNDSDSIWESTERPTRAGLVARQFNVNVATEKILANDAKDLGVSLGVGSNKISDDTNDFYKITLDVSNLGELYWAYNSETYNESEPDQVQFYNLEMQLPGLQFNKIGTKSTFNGKAWDATSEGKIIWTASSANASDLYPACTYDGSTPLGVYVENASLDQVVVAFAVAKGYTYEATPSVLVVYQLNPSDGGNAVENTNANVTATCNGVSSNNKVKFAPAVTTYPIEMTVTEKEDTPTGYIWALAFGANKDKLASLTATFEDGVRAAFVANIPAAAVTAVTGGTTTINVGLKTGATLTGATFVAGNSDVNTEATTQVLYK